MLQEQGEDTGSLPVFVSVDMMTMCDTSLPYYLQRWVETVEAMQIQAMGELEPICGKCPSQSESQSEVSYSTGDLDEYLIDINEGMDKEGSMANEGEAQMVQGEADTVEVVVGCSQDEVGIVSDGGRAQGERDESGGEEGGSRMIGINMKNYGVGGRQEGRFGNLEIKKRKPPDGDGDNSICDT